MLENKVRELSETMKSITNVQYENGESVSQIKECLSYEKPDSKSEYCKREL